MSDGDFNFEIDYLCGFFISEETWNLDLMIACFMELDITKNITTAKWFILKNVGHIFSRLRFEMPKIWHLNFL